MELPPDICSEMESV